ncbi:MAG: ribonuclease HII [Alphaproteobacteria bacterium]|nr:ribonuclease HII [Alphaproteobacteria bacterium]
MPDFTIEKKLAVSGAVFGLDEAGRGPWCGPVVAACVYWPDYEIPIELSKQIDDSKKLTPAKRDKLYEQIIQSNAIYGIGLASSAEIDELNILQATFLAMKRALDQVASNQHLQPAYALIDGNRLPKDWTIPSQAVIHGDHLSLSIAAASILAKVTRDRLMEEMAHLYPQYGWAKNAGYGTKEHIEAIQKYGITPFHRRSYAPIKKYLDEHPAVM